MEADLIAWLREHLPPHPRLLLGPGDDAAVLSMSSSAGCVVTTDLVTEGVDFILAECDARLVGRKALAVNLSDIAAMAARPVAAVIALALPRTGGMQLALDLYAGLLPLAEEFKVAIAGGDTNSWDGPLVVSITLIGETTDHGPLRRHGAQPGDWIVVSGVLGGSIFGHHFDFSPRINEALLLHQRYGLHAGMDISDGLSLDLSRLATESGCGAELNIECIPISPAAKELALRDPGGVTALAHALSDGEDFELLLAAPPDEAQRMVEEQPLDVPLTAIGRIVAERGLWQVDAAGGRTPLEPRGYEHRF